MATTDLINNLKAITISVTGPASYAAGGFAVDASASLSWMGFMMPTITVVGVLPGCEYEIVCNQDTAGAEAFGKGVLKIVKHTYQKGSTSSVTGQPGGVTVQAALSANSASTHTHTINHNHGAVTSSTETQAGTGSAAAVSPDALAHVHSFTIPNFSASTASSGSHTHNRAFEYAHQHSVTTTTTNVTATEITAGTDLSGVTFKVICWGFGLT